MENAISSLSVLVVDDNPADVRLIQRYLENSSIPWDLEFNSCNTPDELLDFLSDRTVDLVFLDYKFPEGDGLTTLKHLRQNGHDMPVILLTGKGSRTVALEAYESGVKGYLTKENVDANVLREAIDNALLEDYLWEDSVPERIERNPDAGAV